MIIDGKELASHVRKSVSEDVKNFKDQFRKDVKLAVIQVGNDAASCRYVRNKEKACQEVGIISEVHKIDENVSVDYICKYISNLNMDPSVNGILVQLPIPGKTENETNTILRCVDDIKDVDGFKEYNLGKLLKNEPGFVPCTPSGIEYILKSYKIQIEGSHCVIVGRSNIVGKPVSMLMLNNNATVTICHSKTINLSNITKQADILIVAVGKSKFITGGMIKPHSTVIDVGINIGNDGKLCGDVDFESCKDIADFITPVPGGVGPMTVAMLLNNTLVAAKAQMDVHKLYNYDE